jgi:hypothetical protein
MGKEAVLVAAFIVGILIMSKSQDDPRGIRNNNPLNIRVSPDNWEGKVGDDGSFVVFESPLFGIRAASRILKTYREKYNLISVSSIIARWAPESENDTQAYIESVAGKIGVNENDVLHDSQYPLLIAAMIYHENGVQPYSPQVIDSGFKMGFYV